MCAKITRAYTKQCEKSNETSPNLKASMLENLSNNASTNGLATLPKSETREYDVSILCIRSCVINAYRVPTSAARSLWSSQTTSMLSPGITILLSTSVVPSGHSKPMVVSAVRMNN